MLVVRCEVYGHALELVRDEDGWQGYPVDRQGRRRATRELFVPPHVEPEGLPDYLARLCVEWRTPEHPEVRLLDDD